MDSTLDMVKKNSSFSNQKENQLLFFFLHENQFNDKYFIKNLLISYPC